jgi:hypothetical protein
MQNKRAHMLRMHFTPTAIEHGIVGWKHRLVSNSAQKNPLARNCDASDCTNLNGDIVPLFNRNRDLPVAHDPKVLTAPNNKPDRVPVSDRR